MMDLERVPASHREFVRTLLATGNDELHRRVELAFWVTDAGGAMDNYVAAVGVSLAAMDSYIHHYGLRAIFVRLRLRQKQVREGAAKLPVLPPVPAHLTERRTGRGPSRAQPAPPPQNACAYMSVVRGRVETCGARTRGQYCRRHRDAVRPLFGSQIHVREKRFTRG